MDGAVIVDAEEEGEREAPSLFILFLRFVVSYYAFFRRFNPPSCRFVVLVLSCCCFSFVVLFLRQIREPRGALLFAPKEETCGEINRRRFLLADSFGD